MSRRQFLFGVGAAAMGGLAMASYDMSAAVEEVPPARLPRFGKTLRVLPVLTYEIPKRREATSWRNWGGIQTEADAKAEQQPIGKELEALRAKAGFPVEFQPAALVDNADKAAAALKTDADVIILYAAGGGGNILEMLTQSGKVGLMFLRHDPGPVYLWYEIAHPRFLRKTVDESGSSGLDVHDVVVDSQEEILWRLRAHHGLTNTWKKRIVAIGGASGWGEGGAKAPATTKNLWKMDLVDYPYSELGPRIQAARKNAALVKRCQNEASRYLRQSGTTLHTTREFVSNAFVLCEVIKDVMDEAKTDAMTINSCMGTIMPMAETTACLPMNKHNTNTGAAGNFSRPGSAPFWNRNFALLVLAMGLAPAFAGSVEQNWPMLRGPLGTGAAPTAKPPISWSETEHVKWKVRIPGKGSSTPVIWDEQIFIQTAIPGRFAGPAVEKAAEAPSGPGNPGMRRPETPNASFQFVLLSLDRSTGKTLWQKVLRDELPQEGHHANHGYASFSPVTDGQVVVSFFGSRGLHCLDMQGNVKWQKDLGKMRTRNSFGEGMSPALSGNTVVIGWDHEGDDFIAAFDKETGKELWRQPRNEATTWATPVIVQHEGKKQVVMSATKRIRGYDLDTGAQLWECGGMTDNVIPTPVTENGLFYAISGFRGASLLAIRLGRTGDLTDSDAIAWSIKKNTPYVPSPLLYGNRLYYFSGNKAVLSCVDAKTGQAIIDAREVEGLKEVYASPLGADGRVYLTGRDGVTVVLKQSDSYEVLATNRLDDSIDASPAAVGSSLFLRGRSSLYCIE